MALFVQLQAMESLLWQPSLPYVVVGPLCMSESAFVKQPVGLYVSVKALTTAEYTRLSIYPGRWTVRIRQFPGTVDHTYPWQ